MQIMGINWKTLSQQTTWAHITEVMGTRRGDSIQLKEIEAAVIGDIVPVEAIEEVESQYRQQVAEGGASDELKFSYAVYLIKSGYKNDIRKGIRLMESDISQGKDQRDHFYFIAMGHYKLEEYEAADRCIDRLLQMEPNNYQAKQLKDLIVKKLTRDGLLGLGVLGGALLVGGALAAGAVALAGMGIAKLAKK